MDVFGTNIHHIAGVSIKYTYIYIHEKNNKNQNIVNKN